MTPPDSVRWQPAETFRDPAAPRPAIRPGRPAHPFRRGRLTLAFLDLGASVGLWLALTALDAGIGARSPADIPAGWMPFLLATLAPVAIALCGLYRPAKWGSWRAQAGASLKVLVWSAGLSVLALFFFARFISWDLRMLVVDHHLLFGTWLLLMRPAIAGRLHRAPARLLAEPERILVVGSDNIARQVARNLARSSSGIEVVGMAGPDRPRGPISIPFHAATLDDLPELASRLGVDLVVLAAPDLPRESVVLVTDRLAEAGVRVQVVSNLFNRLVDSAPFNIEHGVPLSPVGSTPLRGHNERVKRIFDLVATTLGGIVLLPFVLTLALLVRLSSPGPVLYRQLRIGKGGRPFAFFKFRSMRLADEDPVHQRYALDLVQGGGAAATDAQGTKVYKLVDDSRVTPIGRFLRRTSLDELPQLLNVLKGEMSLVGPRPCLPFEYDVYRDWHKRRLDVTPGMTGLWQVTGRSYVTFEDMVLLDLFYIANWSFPTDLRILCKTVPVVIWGKGGL